MSANDHQVGGTHYRTNGEQHWDRMYRMFGPGYFIGCITKYVERYQGKNGLEDLHKARHFMDKLIELEGQKPKMRGLPEINPVSSDYNPALNSLNTTKDFNANRIPPWPFNRDQLNSSS